MRKIRNFVLAALISTGLVLWVVPVFAQDNVAALQKQVEALQKRVAELEAARTPAAATAPAPAYAPAPGQTQPGYNRFDPFSEMSRMQEEMNRMFQNAFSPQSIWPGTGGFKSDLSFDQNMNIQETKKGYVFKFDIAGLDKDKLNLDINEHSITVSGERSAQTNKSGKNSMFTSRSYGSFLRSVPLPEDADATKVQTKKEGDTLVITMPKKSS